MGASIANVPLDFRVRAQATENGMTDKTCEVCKGTGWVCENHMNVPWGNGSGECDCGAGCNCLCNQSGEVEWQAVYATTDEPEEVKEWVH